jgi:uncharacterized protein
LSFASIALSLEIVEIQGIAMILRFAVTLLFFGLPLMVSAQCGGGDLRLQMPQDQTNEMAQNVQRIPFAEGNHWQAVKDSRTVHVIGTIHVYDPRLEPVMDRLQPLIESADLILLEATPEEEKKLQAAITTNPALVFLTDGPTLPELMPEDDWQRLSAAAASRGIPPFMASKFQPWYLSLLMGIPGCAMQEAVAGARGLDHIIGDVATAAGVQMRALEPFDMLFGLFNDDPLDEQIRMLTLSVMPDQLSEDALFTLKETYFEQSPAEAWEFSRYLARTLLDLPIAEVDQLFGELEDLLLTQRNAAWLPRIEDASGDLIVVAVGGAHLMGENGVLQLLENAGYALTRQAF